MSVHITSAVWKKSQHRGTALLMMLALADMANDEGTCWPSQTALAKRAKITTRNTQLQLRKLEQSGEINVLANEGPKGVNKYQINLRALGKGATIEETPEENFGDEEVFGSPENLSTEPPKPVSGRNVNESSMSIDDPFDPFDDSALSDDPFDNGAPEREAKPYDYWVAFCDGAGMDPSQLKGAFLSRQLAVAKRMATGMTVDEMTNLAAWIMDDPWWRSKGIDLFIAEKQFSKWVQAGKPASHVTVTGREKRIAGSTPRG